MWCYYGDQNSTKQKPSSGVSHCCLPVRSAIHIKWEHNVEECTVWSPHRLICKSPPCDAPPACPRPYPLHRAQYDYSERRGGKKSISCNAARVQNCPNSSQAQPDTTAYSQSRLCLWTQFSLAHFDSLFGCVLWHLAQILPTCLFCLLSRDDSAIVLVNHLNNTYEACSLHRHWNCVYIFYKLQGGAVTPHL